MAEFTLDARVLPPWAIAAQLDSIIAYPRAGPKRLTDIMTSRCSAQIQATIKADPTTRQELLDLFPSFNPATVRTSTKRFDTNRENAQRAGSVFLAMIQQTTTGSGPTFKGEVIAPTLDRLVALRWADIREPDDPEALFEDKIHSIEHREVRARYPVAHLCAA